MKGESRADSFVAGTSGEKRTAIVRALRGLESDSRG